MDDPAVAAAVVRADPDATAGPATALGDQPADGVLLLSGELAAAGERAPAVIDTAVRRCRPGGVVAVTVPSAVYHSLNGGDGGTAGALTAAGLDHLLAERGVDVGLLAAPGAAARLACRAWAGVDDLELDRVPGLLDGAPSVLAVGRTPRSPAERSRTFFSSIARKIVSASALCRDQDDRLLVVFDSFKGQWTLPGGLIDADENPLDTAVREVREEGGVAVRAGALLGVFAHAHPDRINLVYAATPTPPVPDRPVPLHHHEIDEARWVPLPAAVRLLDGDWPRKVRICLERPGKTWRW